MSQNNVISITFNVPTERYADVSPLFDAVAGVLADPSASALDFSHEHGKKEPVVAKTGAPGGDASQEKTGDGNHTAANPPTIPPGVTVDKEGLPWDERIHASTKAINEDGTWRKKRGLDKSIIAPIEAQLRALMQVPTQPATTPANDSPASVPGTVAATEAGAGIPPASVPPVTTAPAADVPPVSAAPVTTAPPVSTPPPSTTPPPASRPFIRHEDPQYAGWISYDNGQNWEREPQQVTPPPAAVVATAPVVTAPGNGPVDFPQVMTKITTMSQAGKTDTARVSQALANVGLTSVPDLGKRPDLIPAFAQHLDKLAGL